MTPLPTDVTDRDRRYPRFTIGWRLRIARHQLGPDMDVRAFADLLGVSKNTVTAYELEQTRPERMKPLVLKQWAIATGVDPDWLRTGVTPPSDIPTASGLVHVPAA